MKLLLGSGDWHWGDQWCHVDANPNSGADVIASIPPLPDSVKANRYEQVLASHFLEHLYRWEALALLQECYEVLLDGGMLILELPNLAYCAKIIAGVIDPPEGRSREQFGWWGVFGRPELDSLMGHKYGYTPETLTDLVVEAGFNRSQIVITPGIYHEPVRDMLLRVTK